MLIITYSDYLFIVVFPLSFSPLFPFHSRNHHTVVRVHESYLYKLRVYFCTHDQKAGFVFCGLDIIIIQAEHFVSLLLCQGLLKIRTALKITGQLSDIK